MKKTLQVILLVLLACLGSINEVRSELLDPELKMQHPEIKYLNFGFDYDLTLQGVKAEISCEDGVLRWIFTIPDLIQTKSLASLSFTCEGDNIPISVNKLYRKQQGDVYKYDIQLVYDGIDLGLKDIKGVSKIVIKQESNDTYRSATSEFQINFDQTHKFAVQIVPWNAQEGSVHCYDVNNKYYMLQGSIGYFLDSNYGEGSQFKFTFSSKQGFHIKDVKVNGISQGSINYYVTEYSQQKNFLIEVIWEKDSDDPYIEVLYKEERGTIMVNDVEVKNGQKVSIEKGCSVSVRVVPKDGSCRGWVKLTPQREISTMTMAGSRTDPVIYKFDDFVENMTFDYLFYQLYDANIKVSDGGAYDSHNWVKIDGNWVYPDPSDLQTVILRRMTGIEMEFSNQEGYYLKRVLIDGADKITEISENKLVLSDPPSDIKVEYAKTLSVSVSYNEGGAVMVNDKSVTSGNSVAVDASTDVKVMITPNNGYHIKQVKLGTTDVTDLVRDNLLTISSISENSNVTVIFEKDAPVIYLVKVTCSNGGSVKVNGQSVTSGNSISVNALSDVKVTIIPDKGYHLKSMKLGSTDVTNQIQDNVFTISAVSANEEITVTFEKDLYAVKVTYSAGGTVRLNDRSVTSGSPISVDALTDVKISIIPNAGYHLKQVKIGAVDDVTDQVNNNVLTIPAILENKEVTVVFEKNAATSFTFRVNASEGGKVKVDGKTVENGSSVTVPVTGTKLEFLPDNKYRVAKVLLGSKDITDEIVDNVYNVTSVSSNMSLSVTFEKIPTYKLNINMTGGTGSIKIGDKTVTQSDLISNLQEGTMLSLNFLPDNYYEVKRVILGGSDISSQIRNGYYEIQSIESDLTLSVEYQRKSYTLTLSTIQGIEKIYVNQKEYKDVTQIELLSGEATISVYSNELYYIGQVLLSGKVIYDDNNNATSAHTGNLKIDMNGNKDLTVVLTLREKRQLSVKVTKAGTLNSLLSENDKLLVTHLIVEGDIDQRDFEVMNQMGSLLELDLKNTTVVKYGIHSANTIPDKAFNCNQKIQSMYLPKSIEAIGNQSFYGSVISTFPSLNIEIYEYKYLKKIGEEAFKNCSHLINGPRLMSVELIEKGAFENCSNMYGVGILQKVKEIKNSAFKNCVKCSIQFTSGSNIACLEKVGDYAFENMKAVYFDDVENLSYIGYQALKGCQNTSFNFSDCLSLTELPSFENCSNMQSIVFPPKVKRVYSNSFIGCSSLQSVHMAGDISIIEEYAFKDCPAIDYVYLSSEEVPQVSLNSFCNSVYQSARLFVPVNRLQFYKEDAVWGKFKNIRTHGIVTNYVIEILLSEGGTVGTRQDEEDWVYCYYGYMKRTESSRIYFHVRPERGFIIESVILNDADITNTLDENNQFVLPYLMENVYLSVKFKKESDPTSIDQLPNTTKRVYRSAPRRLALSGFEAGVPVYVYDGNGRLVVLKTIRDSVEVVDVPSDGLYFVRIGKESFKVIL